MAKPKRPTDTMPDNIVTKPCNYREGDWLCTRNAVYDVYPFGLLFREHVGEPRDLTMNHATGVTEPVHAMTNTRSYRQRILGCS